MGIPSPGDVLLGKYRVERVLGQGGMGVVVAVRHLELGQLFAIKFLLPSALGHREALERFIREARAAARLRSEHVAHVHDVGRMEGGAPYMLMEYLEGSDLKGILAQQGALPVEQAVSYLLQVCDAIMEAHKAGIIHRDLKPANLFVVQRPNGSACVKVLDFGISKDTSGEDVELTRTNAMFGSVLYMSPEQMAKTKTVDVRTDIWALGAIFYELVTGRSPFKAPTMTEVISLVLQEEPTPPRELCPGVSPELEAVILRCLSKRREDRFSNVGELVEALRAAVPLSGGGVAAGAPLSVRPAMGSVPMVPMEETQTRVIMPAARSAPAALVVPPNAQALGAGAVTGDATTAAWGHTGHSAGARKGRARWMIGVGVGVAMVFVGGGVWLMKNGGAKAKAAQVSAVAGGTETVPFATVVSVQAPPVPVESSAKETPAPSIALESTAKPAPSAAPTVSGINRTVKPSAASKAITDPPMPSPPPSSAKKARTGLM